MARRQSESSVLNPVAFEVAGLLRDYRDRLTIKEIAQKLGKREPSIHRILQKFLQEGLISKESAGKRIYYYISEQQHQSFNEVFHGALANRKSLAALYTPQFTMVSIEDKLETLLNAALKASRFRVVRGATIRGRYFDHETTLIVENEITAGVELLDARGKNSRHRIFNLAGRLTDIPRSALAIVFIVALGYVRREEASFLEGLTGSARPEIAVISLDEPINAIDDLVLKRKVVAPFVDYLMSKDIKPT